MARLLTIIAFLLATVPAFGSGRCNPGQLAGGLHCACPDFAAQIAQGLIACPSGFEPVIYDLSKPFPRDGTRSTLTMRGSTYSMCPTFARAIPVTGHLVLCWSPPIQGCRRMVVPYNSLCFHTASEALGPDCSVCDSVSTSIVAIMNAGAAGFRVCPPREGGTACRSTSLGSDEIFRFQPGGFCVTDECGGASPGPDTCVGAWGATYFGFGRRGLPKGWYDWASGAFRVDFRGLRRICGALGECLGDRGLWIGRFVATPSPDSPNLPPCLTKAGDACNPATCMP